MRHHLAISRIFGIACVKVLSFQTCVHVVKGNYVDVHWCNALHCFVTWYALLFVKRCVGRCGLFPGPTIPCTGEKKWAFLRNDKLRRNRTKSLMGGWIFWEISRGETKDDKGEFVPRDHAMGVVLVVGSVLCVNALLTLEFVLVVGVVPVSGVVLVSLVKGLMLVVEFVLAVYAFGSSAGCDSWVGCASCGRGVGAAFYVSPSRNGPVRC